MTYEQIVEKVRSAYENSADARDIFEHVAVQVNVIGEGHGAFYVEVANRQICVEPYEYYDRDGIITVTADVIMQIIDGEISFEKAYSENMLQVQGNMEKMQLLEKIKFKNSKSEKKVKPKKSVAKSEIQNEIKTEINNE